MPTLAVCSWSLEPTSPEDLVAKLHATSVGAVQLALGPLVDARDNPDSPWHVARARKTLADAGIRIVSGMMATIGEDYTSLASIRETGGIVPDRHWATNLDRARLHARLACELGLRLVTFHAGFVPHDRSDPLRGVLIERLRVLARLFACYGVTLGLETGQERAATLLDVLADVNAGAKSEAAGDPSVRINFDPANMLLYGMGDPIASLRAIAEASRSHRVSPSLIAQVHIKDAVRSDQAEQWGSEIAVSPARNRTADGRTSVDWPAFFAALREHDLLGRIDLVIEREAGQSRVADVAAAAALVRSLAPDHEAKPLRIGVLGMGFMGQTHARAAIRAHAASAGCMLAAVCDPRIAEIASRLGQTATGNLGAAAGNASIDLAGVRLAQGPGELFRGDDVDLIIVATPTDTHVDCARAALDAGKHVIVEKPVATTRASIDALRRHAARYPTLACVPAMVMRWWPGWALARGMILEDALGALCEFTLERMGQPPTWSHEFYTNALRSGGAIVDLHVHDVDFLCWTLGTPQSVTSTGTIQHVRTAYKFARKNPLGAHAVGSWELPEGERFRIRLKVVGEHGAIEFDLGHDPLFPAGVCKFGGVSAVSYDTALSPYELQLRDIVDSISRGLPSRCSLEQAAVAASVIEREQESLLAGREVTV
jgi:predicted dehydrogenase/sugar phosphate isomerase/epimerase